MVATAGRLTRSVIEPVEIPRVAFGRFRGIHEPGHPVSTGEATGTAA
jgi:hypothetical protein